MANNDLEHLASIHKLTDEMEKDNLEFQVTINNLVEQLNIGALKRKLTYLQFQYYTMFLLWLIIMLIKPTLMILSVGIIVENNFGTNFFDAYLLNPNNSFTYTIALMWSIITILPFITKNPFIMIFILGILFISAVGIKIYTVGFFGPLEIIIAAALCWIVNSRIDFYILKRHLIDDRTMSRIGMTRNALHSLKLFR